MKYLFFAILILSGCATTAPISGPVEISSLAHGPMLKQRNGVWTVYENGTEFTYRANGKCVVVGVLKDCMWIGYEFDFRTSNEKTVLECVTQFSKPTDMVKPHKAEARGTSEYR